MADLYPNLTRYYKTEAWKRLKLAAKRRDRFKCRVCNVQPQPRRWWQIRPNYLTVHHMSSVAWERSPGNEPLSDLLTVCRFHHEEIHARHRSGAYGSDEESLRRCSMEVVERGQAKIARQAAKRARKLARA